MSSFHQSYSQLNQRQRQTVDTIEGPVMVIAGPGTGKTQILTLRIANILLKTQVNPENILALTFTENAAGEMKQRLSELIGHEAFRVHIDTFHGFCNELIQKHFDIFHHLASYMPISDLEEIQIIQEIIESHSYIYLRPQGDPTYYFNPIRTAISSLKKEGVSPSQFKKAVEAWKAEFEKRDDLINTKGKYKGKMKGHALDEIKHIEKNKEFGELFELYGQTIKERKLYDFNDMIIEVINAFKRNDQFLSQIRETYQYILIDEHQDTNNSQNTIIEYICGLDDFPNLFVVGDEKQSIFRFQGASLENFLYFQKTFPRATLITLDENYRSTQKILDVAHSLIQYNSQRIDTKTNLASRSSYPEVAIKLTTYANPQQELFQIANSITHFHAERKTPYEQMAIIVRKNADLLEIASVLRKNNIPYIISSEESVFSDRYIQKIISLLQAIFFVGEDAYLSHILLMDIFNVDPLEVFLIIQSARKNKVSLWEFVIKHKSSDRLAVAIGKLVDWKKRSENEAIDEFFISLLHESGILELILKEQDSLPILEKLNILYEDLKLLQRKNHLLTLGQYIDYLQLLEEHAIAPQVKGVQRKLGSVFVSTAHKAKGLEFEYVFIPKTTDSYWGNTRGQTSLIRIPWKFLSRVKLEGLKEETIEEERRLFYVALTRAKKELLLSYSVQNEEGKDQLASRFIFEIPENLVDKKFIEEVPAAVQKRILLNLSAKKQYETSFNKAEIQEYFRSLFIQNGVSVSALNNYLTCPWKYIFRNLIRLPDVRGYYLLLGTAVHEAIREYISQKKKKVHLEEEELIRFFRESIKLYSASEKDLVTLSEKGSLIIRSYYQKRMKGWDMNRESELVIPNMYLDTDISINGKIDMLEFKNKEVVVFDFKTGKAKSRNALLGGTQIQNKDYYRQLVFYKLLLSLYKKGYYKMKEGVIEFVESATEGDIKNESFIIQENEVKDLIQSIRDMRDSILSLSFWDRTCEDKDCEYCRLRSHFYRPLT